MSIQKRLFWSNILMIVIPVVLSAFISYIILFVFTRDSTVPMEKAFPQAFEVMNRFQRSGDVAELHKRADEFNSLFLPDGVFLAFVDENTNIYPAEALELAGENGVLLQLLLHDGATGFFKINDKSFTIEQVREYRIILAGSSGGTARLRPRMRNLFIIFVIVLIVILLTNRLLTYILSRSIIIPLRKLAYGARQLGEGDLDYRIGYTGGDEFANVCQSFNEMAGKLQELILYQQKNEGSRKELLAGISHDLRTPLTSIKAYVEGLLDGVAEDLPAQLKYLSIIKNKAEDIERIVDKLFLFSKLDIGEYAVNLERVDIGEELESMVKAVEEEYREKGLSMVLEDRVSGVFILTDPVYLHNVLTNILENSLRYKQKERCVLTVRCIVEELSVTVSMTDDGPGVRDDELEKIFDVFYRGDSSRQNPSKGSGLGLAISAQMMKRSGGSIRAENAREGGLRVILQFPRCRDAIAGKEVQPN